MLFKIIIKLVRLICWFIISSVILLIVLVLFLNFLGAPIISTILTKTTHAPISLDAINILPNKIHVLNFSIDHYFSFEKADINLSFFPFSIEEISINKPRCKLTIKQFQHITKTKKIKNTSKKQSQKNNINLSILPLLVTKFSITNGEFTLQDQTTGKVYTFDNINITTYHPNKTLFWNIKVHTKINSPHQSGEINIAGWIDLDKKNASFTVKGKNIDLEVIKLLTELPSIQGQLSFTVKGEAKNNVLNLKNQIELNNFCYKPLKIFQDLPVAREIIPGVNKISKKRIKISFTTVTTLTHPNIKIGKMIKKAILSQNKSNKNEQNTSDKKDIYDIINDLAGTIGSVLKKISN